MRPETDHEVMATLSVGLYVLQVRSLVFKTAAFDLNFEWGDLFFYRKVKQMHVAFINKYKYVADSKVNGYIFCKLYFTIKVMVAQTK